METTNVTAAKAKTYFKWLHGLQSARPVKKVFLPWPDIDAMLAWSDDYEDDTYQSENGPRDIMYHLLDIAYHSRRLVYVVPPLTDEDVYRVAVLNLETGNISFWAHLSLDRLDSIKLSDRYLVMLSTNLYGTDLFLSAASANRETLDLAEKLSQRGIYVCRRVWRAEGENCFHLNPSRLLSTRI